MRFQNGRIYLTSHRIIYIDNREPQARSVALPLASVDGVELYNGFMRSSAKITLRTKDRPAVSPSNSNYNDMNGQGDGISKKLMVTEVTWICPICFFSNTLPADFPTSLPVQRQHLPACVTCGIPSTLELITDSIKNTVTLPSAGPVTEMPSPSPSPAPATPSEGIACPRCTFVNHPSMNFCEICGARIVSPNLPPQLNTILRQSLNKPLSNSSSSSSLSSMASQDQSNFVPESDGEGYLKSLIPKSASTVSALASYKLSFRSGGEKPVFEQLKIALEKKAWEIQQSKSKDASSQANKSKQSASTEQGSTRGIAIGIHGLQLVSEQQRAHNQEVLGEALEDLNALMARAKEVVKLAEDYAKYLDKEEKTNTNSEAAAEAAEARRALLYSTRALGLQTGGSTLVTKDKLASSDDEKLYHSELARQLAEFLADNSVTGEQGILSREGGIITLFDLFAVYNRARGVSLISPRDMHEACNMLANLKLPIALRTFNSGLQVVQEAYRTPEVVIRNLLELVNKSDFQTTGVSAIDVSAKFKWSVMIATEELEMAEQRGVLCRDEQLSGTTFYANKIPEVPWNWKAELFGE